MMGGGDQQFCLRWNNFKSSLLNSLPQLLGNDDLTDCTILAEGKTVKAHRVVLSACSHYFKDLFREMQPFYHPVIVLPTTSYTDVCALVNFMYSGEVNIYQDQLPSLLAAATALHIRGLAEVPNNGKLSSPPETPTSSKDDVPPIKRAKIITSTPNVSNSDSSPTSSEPQNLAKHSPEVSDGVTTLDRSPRFETTGDTGVHTQDGSPTLDNSDPIPLTPNANDSSTNYGNSNSEDSHSSETELSEKFLAAVSQGLTNPLSFLPSSSIFPSLTSLTARNKLFATCHICGKSLSNQYNLRVHLETHANLNYSCNLCAHVSRSRDALRKHIAYKHNNDVNKDKFSSQRKNNSGGSPEDTLKYQSTSC